jgi:hypothetical protein
MTEQRQIPANKPSTLSKKLSENDSNVDGNIYKTVETNGVISDRVQLCRDALYLLDPPSCWFAGKTRQPKQEFHVLIRCESVIRTVAS